MLAVTAVGYGMPQQTSARENQRRKHWLFALRTATVRSPYTHPLLYSQKSNEGSTDATAFKDAFVKAQQENEALFAKEEGTS